MRLAYFECFSGVAGDMILGALLDAGLSLRKLTSELKKLKISGYNLKISKVRKNGIPAIKADVIIKHELKNTHPEQFYRLIGKSNLDEEVKEKSREIFETLALAEAKVHGVNIKKVHFHELSSLDTLIDIVGSVIGLKLLAIEKIYFSPFPISSGRINSEHGELPVPTPATAELIRNYPVRVTGTQGELLTPTGVAILTTLGNYASNLDFKLEKIGCGAGSRDYKEFPNLLRIFIGEKESSYQQDEILILETNIDNTSPEVLGYLTEVLLEKGALDVFQVPVYMKKNRPGVILSVLTEQKNYGDMISTIFQESYSSGIRVSKVFREKLPRKIRKVQTQYGKVRVKILENSGGRQGIPEFEDCKVLARKNRVPLKIIYEEVKKKLMAKTRKGANNG